MQFNLNCTVDQLSIRLYMLRPRPRWVSLQRSPDPLAVFMGPTSKGGRGKRGKGEKGKGKGRGGEGREGSRWEGKEGEGEGREERKMGACTHWDFRKSAPIFTGSVFSAKYDFRQNSRWRL